MRKDIENKNFSNLFKTNLSFHDVVNTLSDNPLLDKFISPIKHRRYDFQGQGYTPEWELRNCDEHDRYIDFLTQDKPIEAGRVLKDIHWSYSVQETFIKQFYTLSENGE